MGAIKGAFKFVHNAVVTDGNWPGQRHRFLRSLGTTDWRALYGCNYAYSSDYILAHRRAFTPSTRVLARVTNLAEELAEVVGSYTSLHIRLAGSVIPGTLTEMSAKGRFCLRLQRALRAGHGIPISFNTGAFLNDFHDALLQAGLINKRGHLTFDPLHPHTHARLQTVLQGLVGDERFQSLTAEGAGEILAKLTDALQKADMRKHWRAWSTRRKWAHVAGCTLSLGSSVGLGLALASASTVASPFLFAPLGLAGVLFASSFVLRLLTTAHARAACTHRGLPINPHPRAYRSLYENLTQSALGCRNTVYGRLGLFKDWKRKDEFAVDGIQTTADEIRSGSFASSAFSSGRKDSLSAVSRYVVNPVSQASDLLFSADAISTRLIGRGIRASFCAAQTVRHVAGHTGAGQASYHWTTTAERNARFGRLRLEVARLVGIGGADVIGGSLGCLAVSAAWGGLSVASAGTVPAVLVGGAVVLKPLSGAVISGSLWLTSAALEMALARARHGLGADKREPRKIHRPDSRSAVHADRIPLLSPVTSDAQFRQIGEAARAQV